MSAPIYDYLTELAKKNPYPFHMPGHKRQSPFPMPDVLYDITEINGADNLHKPEGIIKQALEGVARLTGSEKSFFSVNGSSGGIMAAIMSVCSEGDKILICRNCHRSVYNALVLSGAIPIYIYPEEYNDHIAGGVALDSVRRAIEEHSDIRAMLLTSPTYEGFCSDISGIAELLHSKNIPLIVDEAHGAHFGLSDYFPRSAIMQGADISIQSWHKTLPVFTQCSVVNVNSSLIDSERVSLFLSMLQTSSPSYMFMAAMDKCRDYIEQEGETVLDRYADRLESLRDRLSQLNSLSLITSQAIGRSAITDLDRGKLVFEINCDISSNLLENILIKDYNFQIEMCSDRHIILMTSMMDTDEGYDRLYTAMRDINNRYSRKACGDAKSILSQTDKVVMPDIAPREAFYRPKEKININQAVGRIAADFLTPYPPGIPLVAPGEVITTQAVDRIRECITAEITILGLDGESVSVCTE